jgi:hypothetical protein
MTAQQILAEIFQIATVGCNRIGSGARRVGECSRESFYFINHHRLHAGRAASLESPFEGYAISGAPEAKVSSLPENPTLTRHAYELLEVRTRD